MPPAPSGSLSVNSAWRAVTALGRMTSQEMSSANTVAALASLSVSVTAGSAVMSGLAKKPVRWPGVSVQKTRNSLPLRRASVRRNCASEARCIRLAPSEVCAGESSSRLAGSGVTPYSPKMVLAAAPSVTSTHSRVRSVVFISQEAS